MPLMTHSARFDWSLGEPNIIDDNADTTYYGWSLGQSVVTYEYQAEAPPAGDTCTYSGSGDWDVNYSDNCVATTTNWVKGDFNLNYDGAGSFSLRALLQADEINVGTGASISAENSTAQIEIY